MSTTSAIAGSDSSVLLQGYIDQLKTQTAEAKANAANNTSTSLSKVTGDFNTFLKILTTQLQNQDPLNATDTNQFTQELVQFSGVEQQINTNAKLDLLIKAFNSNGITPYLNYVGKTVEVPANGELVVQGGVANFTYTLPYAAQNVTITVTDSVGNAIATMGGPKAAGVNRVSWDGIDSFGAQRADGAYKLRIVATDATGKAIGTSGVNVIALVSSVQTDSDGMTTLSLGAKSVQPTDITAVYSGIASSAGA